MKLNKFLKWTALATAACLATSCVLLSVSGRHPFKFPIDRIGDLELRWPRGEHGDHPRTHADFTRDVPTRGLKEIDLTTVSVDIDIEYGPTDTTALRLEAELDGPAGRGLDDLLTVDFRGDRLTLTTKERKHPLAGETSPLDGGRLRVRVPPSLETLRIKSVSGDILVTAGRMKLLAVENISGDVAVAEDSALQRLEVQSTSGDVSVAGTLKEGKLGTVAGDCEVALTNADFRLEHESVSGDLQVEVPGRPAVGVDFASMSGTLSLYGKELGSALKQSGGPATVASKSVSGGVEIRSRAN